MRVRVEGVEGDIGDASRACCFAKQAGGVDANGELSTAGSCSTGRPEGSKLRAKESTVESMKVGVGHYLQDKGTKG